MRERLDTARMRIDPRHKWFLSDVCGNHRMKYLMHRRLLESTLFAMPSAHAPVLAKAPVGAFDDASWSGASLCDNFVLHGVRSLKRRPEVRTAFRVAQHGGSLYVAVRCEDPAGIRKMPSSSHPVFSPSNFRCLPHMSDYVSVMVDARHDHSSCWQFFGTPSGGKATATLQYEGRPYPVNPLCRPVRREMKDRRWTSRWELRVVVDRDRRGWTAFFRLPFLLLGVQEAPVVGFNVCRLRHSMPPEQSAWADQRWFGENFYVPLRLGDLFLRESPLAVRNLWLGDESCGEDSMALEVVNSGRRALKTTWTVSGENVAESPAVTQAVLRPGSNLVQPSRVNEGRRITIRAFQDGATTPCYMASYEMSAWARMGGNDVARPRRSVREYGREKERWIASRLPRLIRVNTADGAPSDFCLADVRGMVLFDLMKPGAIRRIARMIESRLTDPEDRLAAVDVLTRQPDLFVYETGTVSFGDVQSTSLSVLRLGTGICGAAVTIMKDIVEALHPPNGGEYRAYRCGIMQPHLVKGVFQVPLAHCQLLVLCPDGRQVMLNPFCYRPSDGRLAGPDDVEAFRKARGWKHDPRSILMVDSGSRAWPDGAPLA